jgi:glycosyltransferase involved in cell wall biosynthesis
MRVLFVTPMWPGPEDPDFGSFLVPIVRELRALGHDVDVVAIDRRAGGPRRHLALAVGAIRAARRTKPDVVFAHMLFPAGAGGLAAALAVRAPLVVMAHGQDVANLERPALRAASAPVLRGARALIANSTWLADRIPRPADAIIDCGVDLETFSPLPRGDDPGPHFLCIGSLTARKRVVELADAFAQLGAGGRLTFLGDGPLRAALDGRPRVDVRGQVPHADIPGWIARADVICQPSLVEPFGQAVLEAMAMERAVVGTVHGGHREFVTPDIGVLVDPAGPDALPRALATAVALGTPLHAARAAAARHDVRLQAARMAEVLEAAPPPR